MAFTSLLFIFVFLPVSYVLTYYSKKTSVRNLVLLILSLVFYSWGSLQALIILLLVIAFSYASGLQMEQNSQPGKERKLIFWSAIGFNLFILCFYKYIAFWLGQLGMTSMAAVHAPIGLSFYIFTTISYLADVYMNKAQVQKDPVALALYIAFFGKITMGPISKYRDFSGSLEKRKMDRAGFVRGVNLFFKGLVKKVFLADQLAVVFAALSADSSFLGSWLLALAYTFQLYFDFSGYSDMAIGIGSMFGFDIPPNFNHPYTAVSVQDFWRRWHISLSTWFRDYVYIPLGGNRVPKETYIRNILIVWLLTGIWHGPTMTFIVWGLYYGLLLLGQKFWYGKYLEKLPRPAQVAITFVIAVIGWVFFSSPNMGAALGHLGNMIGIGASSFASENALFYLSTYWLILLLAAVFSTTVYEKVQGFIYRRFRSKAIWPVVIAKTAVFVCLLSFMVSSTAQTFLYNAF